MTLQMYGTTQDLCDQPMEETETTNNEENKMIEVGLKATAQSAQRDAGLKVLFLSSDTGGGHRASAEALAKQFELLYPGTTYDLLDALEKDGCAITSNIKATYKHLSAHPTQWKMIYKVTNTRAFEAYTNMQMKRSSERAVRRRIKSYDADVVVSVHPMMTHLPATSCQKISDETGRHLPFFTVVTDLGSAHCQWLAREGVEKMFIASDEIRALAKTRGKVPDEKLVQAGLPIRHDFAVQAEKMGDRMSEEGKEYQREIREDLGLPHTDRKTVLVMGGGEGVGSLSSIVDALYAEFVDRGIDAQILVVCGRNERLKAELEVRDWNQVLTHCRMTKENRGKLTPLNFAYCSTQSTSPTGCIESGTVTQRLRRILSRDSLLTVEGLPPSDEGVGQRPASPNSMLTSSLEDRDDIVTEDEEDTAATPEAIDCDAATCLSSDVVAGVVTPGNVTVVGLGFVKRMAEHMVAADILVSKAGPGTIAEAASLSLPVMLTSFLPGQEEGNVGFVVDGNFGGFWSDRDPTGIAEEVSAWLLDDAKLACLSKAAKARGAPHAAADIVKIIGESTLRWREINEERAAADAAAGIERKDSLSSSPEPSPRQQDRKH